MANPEMNNVGTEARANEPEEIIWEEPKGTWVDTLTKSEVEALMSDLQCALRIGNIMKDDEVADRALSNVFHAYGATDFFSYDEYSENLVIIVPAVEIFCSEIHSALHISDYNKLKKRKVIFVVSEDGYEKITEEDKDFDTAEGYIIYTGADYIKPAFYFITVKGEGE